MRDVPNLMDKKLLHKNRTLQKRKNIARKYEYSREVLIYMLQTGIRYSRRFHDGKVLVHRIRQPYFLTL